MDPTASDKVGRVGRMRRGARAHARAAPHAAHTPPADAHARLSQVIEDMMSFADKDGDGKVSFEEFKKIMLYKPAPEGDTPAEGYPSTA